MSRPGPVLKRDKGAVPVKSSPFLLALLRLQAKLYPKFAHKTSIIMSELCMVWYKCRPITYANARGICSMLITVVCGP